MPFVARAADPDIHPRPNRERVPLCCTAYGITITSDFPLLPRSAWARGLCKVEFQTAHAAISPTPNHHSGAVDDGTWRTVVLPDSSIYLRWQDVGECLVSGDGGRIVCRKHATASTESFHVYLLGQALAVALARQAIEPLHATVVVIDGRAIAFAGRSGFGKSTLAACFLDAGHKLLTDDLLVVDESPAAVMAFPGSPRIKLFPKMARRFVSQTVMRGGMNPSTPKCILAIDEQRTCDSPVPLEAIYILADPREACRSQTIHVEPLSPAEQIAQLMAATFNRHLMSSERRTRQFRMAAVLARRLPIRKLVYPRTSERLDEVRERVVAEMGR